MVGWPAEMQNVQLSKKLYNQLRDQNLTTLHHNVAASTQIKHGFDF